MVRVGAVDLNLHSARRRARRRRDDVSGVPREDQGEVQAPGEVHDQLRVASSSYSPFRVARIWFRRSASGCPAAPPFTRLAAPHTRLLRLPVPGTAVRFSTIGFEMVTTNPRMLRLPGVSTRFTGWQAVAVCAPGTCAGVVVDVVAGLTTAVNVDARPCVPFTSPVMVPTATTLFPSTANPVICALP